MTTLAPQDAPGRRTVETHAGTAGGYLSLRAIAEVFEDVQRTRVSVEARVRRAPIDSWVLEPQLASLRNTENELARLLCRTYRMVVEDSIQDWQRESIGIGERTLARLLGVIGHPVHTVRHAWVGAGDERELVSLGPMARRVSDLWSYCGHGDPTKRRRRGMTREEAQALGSPRAKSLVYQMSERCIMQTGTTDAIGRTRPTSPYRALYDDLREKYEERSEWNPARKREAALRVVGKRILRDLWVAAR